MFTFLSLIDWKLRVNASEQPDVGRCVCRNHDGTKRSITISRKPFGFLCTRGQTQWFWVTTSTWVTMCTSMKECRQIKHELELINNTRLEILLFLNRRKTNANQDCSVAIISLRILTHCPIDVWAVISYMRMFHVSMDISLVQNNA